MNDPYKVLNVSPSASDEEVKKAYRDLARKYHPDNYHDNPLADLAQEKMKEINEAYDTIQRQRHGRGGAGGGYAQQQSGYGYQQRQQYDQDGSKTERGKPYPVSPSAVTFLHFLTPYSIPRSISGYRPFAKVTIPSLVRVALAYISLSMIGTTRPFFTASRL